MYETAEIGNSYIISPQNYSKPTDLSVSMVHHGNSSQTNKLALWHLPNITITPTFWHTEAQKTMITIKEFGTSNINKKEKIKGEMHPQPQIRMTYDGERWYMGRIHEES